MNSRTLSAGVMLTGTVLISPPAEGAQIDRPNLVVRLYVTAAAHTTDWTASVRQATAILDDAGLGTGWIDCSNAPTLADAIPERCAQPLKSNEVAVRVIGGQTWRHRPYGTLGESLLDPVRRAGTLATIYLDRVEWLARAGGVDAATVLARAMAHEIGHLLLGTPGHSRRGLMRAVWSQQELAHARAADWRFDPEDAAGLQRGLVRRCETAPEAVMAWHAD